jgi:glycosyltransferase involved in cell wall biosynthesis
VKELYKISVVVPCYNDGKYLPQAVNSVIDLKRKDVELIVVDDGSTDEHTCKEIELLICKGIKIVRQKNKGLGAARNAGIKIAQGEFILPLDSDNRVREPYFSDGAKILLEDPTVGIVYGDAEFFGDKTGRSNVHEFDLIRLVMGNYIDACALYRKSLWEAVQGYDEKMPWMGYEDWDFWLRLAGKGWTFHHLNEIAYEYRVSANSMLQRETHRHIDELESYIFSKSENRILRIMRDREFLYRRQEMRLTVIEKSKDYKLGQALIGPARKAKNYLEKFKVFVN